MNGYRIERVGDGVTSNSSSLGLFFEDKFLQEIDRDQAKEFRRSNKIRGILEKGKYLGHKKNQEKSILKKSVKIKELEASNFNSSIIKKNAQKKQEAAKQTLENKKITTPALLGKADITLSVEEFDSLKRLSLAEINKMGGNTIVRIKTFLLTKAYKEDDEVVSYHGKVLLALIKERLGEDEFCDLRSKDITGNGISRKYFPLAISNLEEVGFIKMERVPVDNVLGYRFTLLK